MCFLPPEGVAFLLGAARRRSIAHGIRGLSRQTDATGHHIAWFDEGAVFTARVSHGGTAQRDEFVHIKLVVGEQHKVLELLRAGAGVVTQAVQRVVHAWRGKQRQRQGVARLCHIGTVGNAIVHGGQIRQVKNIAHERAALGRHIAFDVVVLAEREVNRNRLRAGAHLQLHAVVFK